MAGAGEKLAACWGTKAGDDAAKFEAGSRVTCFSGELASDLGTKTAALT